MDFTVGKYKALQQALTGRGYAFRTFLQFMESPGTDKTVVLRHDVDRLPGNALHLGLLEHEMDIRSTYYFRIVPQSFDPDIIRQISGLGHEIGYHYEDLSMAAKSAGAGRPDPARQPVPPELMEKAIAQFELHLEQLRELAPVKTICMHGSPLSRWDNRKLWERYDYRDYGIAGEPYFDVDYSQVFYITDTGRSWRKSDANVRDRVDSGFDLQVRSTSHLIRLAEAGRLPGRIMINTHPQRWHDPGFRWFRELIWQNTKNIGKSFVSRMYR